MVLSRIASLFTVSFVLLFFGIPNAKADAIFNFEADALNKPTPFTDTVNGLSATFGGLASVCASDGLFQSLSGNVLIQSYCGPATQTGPITISFSSTLTGVSFNFATAGGPGSVTLALFEDTASVGTASFASTLPAGRFNGEGTANFSGSFNRLTVTGATLLALDNINARTTTAAVPEPASLATVVGGLGLLAALTLRRNR